MFKTFKKLQINTFRNLKIGYQIMNWEPQLNSYQKISSTH